MAKKTNVKLPVAKPNGSAKPARKPALPAIVDRPLSNAVKSKLVKAGFKLAGTATASARDGFSFQWSAGVVSGDTVGPWAVAHDDTVLFIGSSNVALRRRIPHVLRMADGTHSIADAAKRRGNTRALKNGGNDQLVSRWRQLAGNRVLSLWVIPNGSTDRENLRSLIERFSPAINTARVASPASKPAATVAPAPKSRLTASASRALVVAKPAKPAKPAVVAKPASKPAKPAKPAVVAKPAKPAAPAVTVVPIGVSGNPKRRRAPVTDRAEPTSATRERIAAIVASTNPTPRASK